MSEFPSGSVLLEIAFSERVSELPLRDLFDSEWSEACEGRCFWRVRRWVLGFCRVLALIPVKPADRHTHFCEMCHGCYGFHTDDCSWFGEEDA